MTRTTRILLLVSAVLLLGDAGIVLVNWYTARQTLEATLLERGQVLRDGFAIAKSTTETQLAAIASFVGDIQQVKDLLAEARQAQSREGGGSGGLITEVYRSELLKLVGSRWYVLQFQFLLRQLTFAFDDSTAFLRIEMPYQHGEAKASGLIAAVNADHRPHRGFEISRYSTGLRAAVPVTAEDPASGAPRRLGVIEVGTSLDPLLVPICPTAHCGLGVLLTAQAVATMTPYARDAVFTPDKRAGEWYVEAASNPALVRNFIASAQPPRLRETETVLIAVGQNRWYGVTYFPLFDYRGSAGGEPVGMVAAWQDASELMQAYHRAMMLNVIYAVAAFLLVETMLVAGVRIVTARLEREIAESTAEIRTLLATVTDLADHDSLTGLPNRRSFQHRFQEEISRAERHGEPLCLAVIDLDRFKVINDSHGHQAGDGVLLRLAELLRATLRACDVPCRWGGEEFCLLLPATDGEQALSLLERLRRTLHDANDAVRATGGIAFTFSAGIAQWRPGEDLDQVWRRADQAMYGAKAAGRDRVVVADAAGA